MTPITVDDWSRMSWHARRRYVRNGGTPPPGHAIADLTRLRLLRAGVDVDVARRITRSPETAWRSAATDSMIVLARAHQAGARYITHTETECPP